MQLTCANGWVDYYTENSWGTAIYNQGMQMTINFTPIPEDTQINENVMCRPDENTMDQTNNSM